MPYLVLGVLLVAVCSAGSVITVLRVGDREPALVLARPVSVGQVLTAQDLRRIPVSTDSGIEIIPGSQLRSVLGKSVAYSLPEGTLLSRAILGSPKIPPAGQGLVAVAVQPGRFPPELSAGTTVSVVVVPDSETGGGATPQAGPWRAAVVNVVPQANGRTTVVALRLPTESARRVAAIPSGQLSLVAIPSGGQ